MSTIKLTNKATTLRLLLIIALALILLGIGVGFYLGSSSLKSVASETSKAQSEADASDQKLTQLQNTKLELEKNADIVKKAEQVVAESKSYQYQNQIINDLTMYANQSGMTIKSFTFSDSSSDSSGQATQGQGGSTTSIPNVNSVMVTVELGGDMSYLATLRFVHLIEQNLTRMQISDLSLSGGDTGQQDGAQEQTQTLNIEVYVR